MRVLWPHTFPPSIKNSQVFMNPLADALIRQGIEIIPFYIGDIRRNPRKGLKAFFGLRKTAKNCDIVHAQYGALCGLISAFLPGRKVISLRGSDLYPISNGSIRYRLHLFASRFMTWASLPFFRKIVVMSNDMKRILHRYAEKTFVIPDGIDLQKFYPMDKRTAREKLGVAKDAPCVLFTSIQYDNPFKRVGLALAACAAAKEKYPAIQILIPNNVDHEQMLYYMNASDVILSTSTHEGWPNCVKEALACNVPFVATDVSDLKEVAARKPLCKICSADAQVLGQKIVEVLEDKTERHLRDEMEAMEINVSARKLIDVYEALLSTPV